MVHFHILLLSPLLALATARWSYRVQDRYGSPYTQKTDEALPVIGSGVTVGDLCCLFEVCFVFVPS